MITSPLINALGWTLLHSLWQVCLIAVIFSLVRLFVRRPTSTYRWALASLLLAVSWSSYTFIDLYEPARTTASPISPMSTVATLTTPPLLPLDTPSPTVSVWSAGSEITLWVEPYIEFVVIGWLLGIALLSVRLVGGLWYLTRLKRLCTSTLPAWETTTAALADRLGLRRPVMLLGSSLAKVPMVVGHWRPAILLPMTLITSLPPEQIEAIIAHELVHVRRYDYWVNILQTAIETLFFYHPAVWWLSSVVRAERENCCDDIAVALCGDATVYVQALSEAETLRQLPPFLAPAFAQRRGSLLARIERLVYPSPSFTYPVAKLSVVATTLLIAVSIAVSGTLAHQTEPGDLPVISSLPSTASSQSSVSVLPDTAQPDKVTKPLSDDGWQGSDKARALTTPVAPDTIPDKNDRTASAATQERSHGFSFHIGDSTGKFDMSFGFDQDSDPHAYFYSNDKAHPGHWQAYLHDTLPLFVWDDSLWMESIEGLSEQMGSFSEDLKEYLMDSVDTEVLQEQLMDVQRELGQLQAELGSTLQRSLNKGRVEEWQERMQAEQERALREVERTQRALKRNQERLKEKKQYKALKQARKHDRLHRSFDNTVERLEKELLADKLVKRGEEYRFELKTKGLYINRKKQSDEVVKKYRGLLNVSESTNFSITRTAE